MTDSAASKGQVWLRAEKSVFTHERGSAAELRACPTQDHAFITQTERGTRQSAAYKLFIMIHRVVDVKGERIILSLDCRGEAGDRRWVTYGKCKVSTHGSCMHALRVAHMHCALNMY